MWDFCVFAVHPGCHLHDHVFSFMDVGKGISWCGWVPGYWSIYPLKDLGGGPQCLTLTFVHRCLQGHPASRINVLPGMHHRGVPEARYGSLSVIGPQNLIRSGTVLRGRVNCSETSRMDQWVKVA